MSGLRKRPVLWICAGAAAAVCALVAILATAGSANQVSASSPLIGKAAPAIEGRSLAGTGRVTLSQFGGKWVLVNFAASWCVPCQQEMPQLSRFYAEHHAKGDAVVLAVLYDEADRSGLASMFRARHASWPAVDDGSAVVDYGVGGLPESYLVDPAGTVIAKYLGQVNASQLDSVINAR